MSELPAVITSSYLWQSTLAPRNKDVLGFQRERFRLAFTSFRKRAAIVAAEIRKDIPDLTLHDVTHLDALWETASIIIGEEYYLRGSNL